MQANSDLSSFITRAKNAGKTPEQIRDMLLSAGWPKEPVEDALGLGELVAPPPPSARASGRDVFFYLLSFLTLGISATSLGGILFGLINRYLPDDVVGRFYSSQPLRWSLAWFIVGAPIYLLISRKLVREASPAAAAAPTIRRVLTYLALFLASGAIIGDLAALVYRFVAGEVTVRFVLKVAVILLIGGWIIYYYWLTLRSGERNTKLPAKWHIMHAGALTVVAVCAIIGGFLVAGAPETQRANVRDEQRVSDVQSMYGTVQAYYDVEHKLPAGTVELERLYQGGAPRDPVSGEPYEYTPDEGTHFTLCANFESPSTPEGSSPAPKPLYQPYGSNWEHPVGRHCFDLQVRVSLK